MTVQPFSLGPGEVLIREGLVRPPSTPGEPARLIASRCPACGDVAFPAKVRCGKCEETRLTETLLSPTARVYAWTLVRQTVSGYELPNLVAMVKVPEDDTLLILTQIKGCEPDRIRPGMEVTCVMAHLYTSLMGQRVMGYAFTPVEGGDRP